MSRNSSDFMKTMECFTTLHGMTIDRLGIRRWKCSRRFVLVCVALFIETQWGSKKQAWLFTPGVVCWWNMNLESGSLVELFCYCEIYSNHATILANVCDKLGTFWPDRKILEYLLEPSVLMIINYYDMTIRHTYTTIHNACRMCSKMSRFLACVWTIVLFFWIWRMILWTILKSCIIPSTYQDQTVRLLWGNK